MTNSKYKQQLIRSRRDEILAVILEMIESEDLQAFSLRGVAKSIGMDATTLNHHYGDWSTLSQLIIERLADRRLARVERNLENLSSLEQLPSLLKGNLAPKRTKQSKRIWQWLVGLCTADSEHFGAHLEAHYSAFSLCVSKRLQALGVEPGAANALADALSVMDTGVSVQGGLSSGAAAALDMLAAVMTGERKAPNDTSNDTQQMQLTW